MFLLYRGKRQLLRNVPSFNSGIVLKMCNSTATGTFGSSIEYNNLIKTINSLAASQIKTDEQLRRTDEQKG